MFLKLYFFFNIIHFVIILLLFRLAFDFDQKNTRSFSVGAVSKF